MGKGFWRYLTADTRRGLLVSSVWFLLASLPTMLVASESPLGRSGHPLLMWGSYIGGDKTDLASAVDADAAGNIYIVGSTSSDGWVSGGWKNSLQGTGDNRSDGFLVKLDANGNHVWSTYIGGVNYDSATGVAADLSGNVYVVGSTSSTDWVSGGWDSNIGGNQDGFLVKFSADGQHLWSTYIGGANQDDARGVAVDQFSNIIVVGETYSANWTSNGWKTTFQGTEGGMGFAIKFNRFGEFAWSTYLGGTAFDYATAVAIDGDRNPVVVGFTNSSGWVSGGWKSSYIGSSGFVVKFTTHGVHLWSSFIGGTGYDEASDVVIDRHENVIISGHTRSSGWVSGGWRTIVNANGYEQNDSFMAKLSPIGQHSWSTFLWSEGWGAHAGVDYFDNIYVHTLQSESYAFKSNGTLIFSSAFPELSFSNGLEVSPSGNMLTVGTTSGGNTLSSSWIPDPVGDYDGVILMFEGNWIVGDANGDGLRNVADVTFLADLIQAGSPPPLQIADINGDGVVNMTDVAVLAELITDTP